MALICGCDVVVLVVSRGCVIFLQVTRLLAIVLNLANCC